jgi:hypothetical protein
MYFSKGGFTFNDAYTLPTYLRRFYLKRLEKQYNDETTQIKKQQKKAQRQAKRNPFKK